MNTHINRSHSGKNSFEFAKISLIMKKPVFTVTFPDGSTFYLPEEWEDIFIARYGDQEKNYQKLAERIIFITGKYIENKTFPSKFDGLKWLAEEKEIDDAAFDDPTFYGELWEEWDEQGRGWNRSSGNIPNPPPWADVAEGLMYQESRNAILQKALEKMGAKTKVVTPENLVKKLIKSSKRWKRES
jgi:hypothetical protein